MTKYPDPVNVPFASFTPESTQGITKGIDPPWRVAARQWDAAGLYWEQGRAQSSLHRQHRQLLEKAASAGRAAAEDHGWELHVAQPKFLSWQQLFVETEGVLKRAPFYGPCDNNRECCNVITHVSELQRSDISLPFGPFSPAGEGKVYSEQ